MTSTAVHYQLEEDVHCVMSTYAANKPLWVYVIDGDFGLWIDTGIDVTPEQFVIPCLERHAQALWRRRQMALITHADVDHFGGLHALRRWRPEALALAHPAEKRWIQSPEAITRERYGMHAADGIVLSSEREKVLHQRGGGGSKIDIAVTGGEEICTGAGGDWQVLHLPGHSTGHLALWHPARRWAIIGDAALDWGIPDATGKLGAPPPYYDVSAYRSTLAKLGRLNATRFFTSHFGILETKQIALFLGHSANAIDRLEGAVRSALQERSEGWTLAGLCERAGQLSSFWAEPLWQGLADPLSAHVKLGIERGEIERIANGTQVFYRRAVTG